MIIIKTKQGDIMVRDGATDSITHNRETRTATIKWNRQDSGTVVRLAEPIIEHVERVVYINDQTGNEWQDEGLQVQELQKRLSEQLTETGWLGHWANTLDHATTEFVNSIQNELVMNHRELPDGLFDRLDGIIKKAYDATSSQLYKHGDESVYEQWKEKHLANSWYEADITAELHDTIEEQAAEIRELQQRVEIAERQASLAMQPATPDPGDEPAPPRRPLWRRLVAWFE